MDSKEFAEWKEKEDLKKDNIKLEEERNKPVIEDLPLTDKEKEWLKRIEINMNKINGPYPQAFEIRERRELLNRIERLECL